MSYLTIKDLNLDKHLSVAIAASFVVSIYDSHCNYLSRKSLTKVLQWSSYSTNELMKNYYSAQNNSETYYLESDYPIYTSVVYVAHVAYSGFAYSTYCAAEASYNASCFDDSSSIKQYIHNHLGLLLPLILDYKLNRSRRPFKSPEKVFELLDEDSKSKFLFNLDILR